MTTAPYFNKSEMEQVFCLGGCLEAIALLIKETDVPSMKDNLQKAYECLKQVRGERWGYLVDDKAREKAYKRVEHTQIVLRQNGVDFSETANKMTLDEDKVYDLAETVASIQCYGCHEDKHKCKTYEIFRGLCMPAVYPNCDKNKCEYRVEKTIV